VVKRAENQHGVLAVVGLIQCARIADLALWSSDPEGDPAEGWLDVVLLRPTGRGRVLLASTDPAQQPRIWLPTPTDEDVEVVCHGVRQALEVAATSALRTICNDPPATPTKSARLDTWVRANAYSLPHTVGSCAMGTSPDDGAVVDRVGRVYGVTGYTSSTRQSCQAHQRDFRTWSR
jgi:choline dehydrogenase